MSLRLPSCLLSLLSLALLAGCGRDDPNAFAPPCPRAAILADAADLARYRPGPGRDLTDLQLAGRILGISGDCKAGDTARQLATTLRVTFELARGPAMAGRAADVAIFVAVSEGDRILDKKLLPARVSFPANTDTTRVTTDPIAMVLPVSPDKSGAAYAVTAGFQLTPEELQTNRSGSAR